MNNYLFGLINLENLPNQKTLKVPEFPSTLLSFDINNFDDGDEIEEIFFVSKFEEYIASNKKPYLDITFGNGVKGKMFDENWKLKRENLVAQTKNYFETVTKVVTIKGIVNEFPKNSGNKSINIETFKPAINVSPTSLLPSFTGDIEPLVNEFYSHINSLDLPYKPIADYVLNKYWHEFSVKAAAKSYHHNYLGGLLKHSTKTLTTGDWLIVDPITRMDMIIEAFMKESLKEGKEILESETNPKTRDLIFEETISYLISIRRLYIQRSKEQPTFNKNVFVLSIFLHDIGKLWEYGNVGEDENKFALLYPHLDWSDLKPCQTGIDMDEEGKKIGHIEFGLKVLDQAVTNSLEKNELKGSDFLNIAHCIASHHGKPEWGSRTPETLEAILLHFVDYVDSRYEKYVQKQLSE